MQQIADWLEKLGMSEYPLRTQEDSGYEAAEDITRPHLLDDRRPPKGRCRIDGRAPTQRAT
jgi:hypothetical protein